ncbi:MAG TPA: peptidase S41 [Rhodospirillaceae bacterium]|nr:peptidase S41 [Alphaproteobacteria bacterium]MAS48613.1 peptidase S41 [Alphaproteobacteria bacterium]MBN54684.1 peptidase S41 [Alphaproteobacteria bacterium]OUT39260.1 MAG: peptidase S41 [Micavibrio sp. TMED2]HCI46921.1 peptidase S41 [Rhodospirillaceae bacterium]|tara:strand:- start:7883 stop:9199 length:1317 start_codon:yes stop_codon:yes gene_type:complete
MRSSFIAATLSLALAISPIAFKAQAESSGQSSAETYQQLTLFGDVLERVRAEYVTELTDKELIEAAINGMLTSLDPHSGYLNEANFRDMRVKTRGEFGGLGIEVTMENGFVKVVSPIDDTPAANAGIQPGDYITHLDDEPVLGLTLSEAVEKMRGRIGTTIVLTVRREGETEALEIPIKRDVIRIRSVRSEIQGDIGIIRVSTFSEQTSDGVEDAIASFKDELGDKLTGVVLDLRNNPGGLLDQAISVSDIFLDKGEIVSTRGRREEDSQRYNASTGDDLEGLPIVVLINGGSASASEIVAGALKDHRRALIIGTKSFGKGSVQTIMPLSGNVAIRLTTARYYTPSGVSIQAEGIEPDIEVKPARLEEIAVLERRREADLRGALNNPDHEDVDVNVEVEVNDQPVAGNATDEQPFDYQLARAVDLLRGVSLFRSTVVN